jgi:hypothetical protein
MVLSQLKTIPNFSDQEVSEFIDYKLSKHTYGKDLTKEFEMLKEQMRIYKRITYSIRFYKRFS